MQSLAKPPSYFYPVAVVSLIWFAWLAALDFLPQTMAIDGFVARFLTCVQNLGDLPATYYAVGIWAGVTGALLLLGRSILAPLAWALSFLGTLGFVLELWKQSKFSDLQMPEIGLVATTLSLSLLLYLYARAINVRRHLI